MTFTYERSSSARDQVRLLISDVNPDEAIFQDEEIDQFISLQNNNVFRSAALALRTIAANQVMVLKVINLLDLQTDGASVARELREQANELDKQAIARGSFAIAELTPTAFAKRQRLINEALKNA